jgi:lipoate synthase
MVITPWKAEVDQNILDGRVCQRAGRHCRLNTVKPNSPSPSCTCSHKATDDRTYVTVSSIDTDKIQQKEGSHQQPPQEAE